VFQRKCLTCVKEVDHYYITEMDKKVVP